MNLSPRSTAVIATVAAIVSLATVLFAFMVPAKPSTTGAGADTTPVPSASPTVTINTLPMPGGTDTASANPMTTDVPGTVVNPDGSTTRPDGTVVKPDGTQIQPDGTIIMPDGTIVKTDGTKILTNGTTVPPGGTMPDGTINTGTTASPTPSASTGTTASPTPSAGTGTTPAPAPSTTTGTTIPTPKPSASASTTPTASPSPSPTATFKPAIVDAATAKTHAQEDALNLWEQAKTMRHIVAKWDANAYLDHYSRPGSVMTAKNLVTLWNALGVPTSLSVETDLQKGSRLWMSKVSKDAICVVVENNGIYSKTENGSVTVTGTKPATC